MKEISFRRKHIEYLFMFGILCTFLMRPTQVHGSWASGGPYGGDINCLAMARTNPDVIYAGMDMGVFKTIDGGDNWSKTGFPEISVRVVDIASNNSNILYAGTDDGLYRSGDGGNTWALIGLSEASVDAIAVHPVNPSVVYAGTNGSTVGIYKTTDSGDTWQEKLSAELDEVGALLIDTDNPEHVYAGIRNLYRSDNFCKSTNGGGTWVCSRVGRISTPTVISLAMTPAASDPAAIYAGVDNWDVYKSIDRGAIWESKAASKIPSLHPCVVSVDPNDPDVVYLGNEALENLYKSMDGAETWTPKTNGLPRVAPSDILVDPRNSAVYVGFPEGGIYKSTDGAQNWSRLAIKQTFIEGLAVNPTASGMAFAAVTGYGHQLARTTDSGLTWDYLVDSPTDLGAVTIDPKNPSTIFVGRTRHSGSFFYIYKSMDGGQSWAAMRFLYVYPGTTKLGVSDIWVHPDDSNTILVAGADFAGLYEGAGGIYKSTDGGAHWNRPSNFWAATLASDPNNPMILYCGSERLGYVFRSTDIGSSWTRISPGGEWVYAVRDIEVDANSHVYAATNEGLMKWDGSVWSKLSGLPTDDITALAIDRDEVPEIIYVGTGNDGVFVSQDGGATWISFNGRFPNLPITKLTISATHPKMLYAGTGPGGVWQISLSPPGDVSGDGGVGLEDAVLVLQILSEITRSDAINIGGDVNGDGKIGLEEAIYVLQEVAGL